MKNELTLSLNWSEFFPHFCVTFQVALTKSEVRATICWPKRAKNRLQHQLEWKAETQNKNTNFSKWKASWKKAATGGGCFCFRFRLHASTAPKRSQEERKRRTESSRKRWIESGKPGKRSNLKQSYDSAVALNFPQPTEFETETKTVNETETDFF